MSTPETVRRPSRRVPVLAAAMLLAAMVTSGCGGAAAGTAADTAHRLEIVTTVSPITNIVSTVVGDLALVEGVVPEGTNSHTFEPSPSVAEALARADLVVMNGLQLEEPTRRLADEVIADTTPIVALGDIAIDPDQYVYDFAFPEGEGRPNPHLWTDPSFAVRYAEIVRDEVSALDPANATAYHANYERFARDVAALDAAMRAAFATVPAADRKLVTYHDAYAYMAEHYGWTVVGAVQPDDVSEPSARDIARLVEQIRGEGVKAIFGSEVFPSTVLDQIEAETGAVYVDDLRDDDLPGAPGDPEHSWLELMRFNYGTIVKALGGDPAPLEALAFATGTGDRAEYPQ